MVGSNRSIMGGLRIPEKINRAKEAARKARSAVKSWANSTPREETEFLAAFNGSKPESDHKAKSKNAAEVAGG